ncbi:unnamed protein product [Rotaria sp. Silwood2]|nr:unnamed protein product [Rotaria sp. Silwood2]CAF4753131.1 unnamed protein product [Rotaria sp. Silwood2]
MIASAAKGAGTKITDASAPVAFTASATVLKTGKKAAPVKKAAPAKKTASKVTKKAVAKPIKKTAVKKAAPVKKTAVKSKGKKK